MLGAGIERLSGQRLQQPDQAMRSAVGEMGEELLLSSQKVEPGKLISSGYPFRYRELRASLKALLGR